MIRRCALAAATVLIAASLGSASARTDSASGPWDPSFLVSFRNLLIFRASDAIHGRELWRSDGTAAGTVLVKDINPVRWSDPKWFTAFGNRLFFKAKDERGPGLWKTDGTSAGTKLVKRFPSPPRELTVVGNRLFFVAKRRGDNRRLLFRSDGTGETTIRVRAGMTWPKHLTEFQGLLYFAARDRKNDFELWRSDGTVQGTYQVEDINPSGDSRPERFTALPGVLLFSAVTTGTGREIWRTDGTSEGTILVRDINQYGDSNPQDFARVGDIGYFVARDGSGTWRIWRTDGSSDGTTPLDQVPWEPQISPIELTPLGDLLYFVVLDGRDNSYIRSQLWRSDGTSDGTTMVKEVGPEDGPGFDAWIRILTAVGDVLYFEGDDDVHGMELWISDGTEEGTRMVRDICSGRCSSRPYGFTMSNGTVFFGAIDSDEPGSHWYLWRTDGTEGGTERVAP